METWERHFKKGKDNLSRHSPRNALKELQIALEECPAKENRNLAKVMFYLGITLKKLGVPNGAVKSWVIARKLNKTGYSAKMIKRFVNEYGMTKQESSYQDDWKAFHAIQLSKYLELKIGGEISDPAERDAITELIWDSWNRLCDLYTLHELSTEEKIEYFHGVKIFFPIEGNQENSRRFSCIHVDFHEKQRISTSDRCSCGSGLLFGQCCGRTPGEDEL